MIFERERRFTVKGTVVVLAVGGVVANRSSRGGHKDQAGDVAECRACSGFFSAVGMGMYSLFRVRVTWVEKWTFASGKQARMWSAYSALRAGGPHI